MYRLEHCFATNSERINVLARRGLGEAACQHARSHLLACGSTCLSEANLMVRWLGVQDQLPKDGRPSVVDGGADKTALLEDSLSAAPRSMSLARVLSTRPTSHNHSGKKVHHVCDDDERVGSTG